MTRLRIEPGSPLRGTARVPGDKSISHRAALLAALAEGESRIDGFLVSGVTRAMLGCLTGLGVEWRLEEKTLIVEGRGLGGWRSPAAALDCGNSATTLRLLAGACAAAGVEAVLDGSTGLRRRPMERIVTPLGGMGVEIQAVEGGRAPLRIQSRPAGQKLRGMEHTLEVASAQVKTCLLLAGLAADRPVRVVEPGLSRDHSERMLASMGVQVSGPQEVKDGGWQVELRPPAGPLAPLRLALPGDFSAAAFLIVAALLAPGSEIDLPGVGLNPTRTGLLATLQEMGADIQISGEAVRHGEPTGYLRVRSSRLHGVEVSGSRVVAMIDEFPIFALAAACAEGSTRVRDASELRHKESDRISAICAALTALGGLVEETPDGFVITGQGGLEGGARVPSHGDHRLAMTQVVAGLAARQPVVVDGAEWMDESFPDFSNLLAALGGRLEFEGRPRLASE